MSAIPKEFLNKAAALSDEVTRPYPNSRKIHVEGSKADIRVGMREVRQTPTRTAKGLEENPPVYIYDTSGPYSDPTAKIDLIKGLAPVRLPWLLRRDDTEQLSDFTSDYARTRLADSALAHLRFEHIRKPRRARPGCNVTQMHYARKGVVTPEMEYVAIRETLRLNELRDAAQAPSRAEFRGGDSGSDYARVRARRSGARPRHHSREYQSPRARADDHRPQLPREDQHQHRQLGGDVEHRGGSGKDGMVGALGRRHADGSFHR